MRRLDPAYRARFADGSHDPTSGTAASAMRDEIARTCGAVDAAAFDGFVDWLAELYVVEMPNFIDRNFDSPLGPAVPPGRGGQAGPARRRSAGSAPPSGDGSRDPRLHRLFSFQAMYAGLAPDDALALYAVITYMDSIEGVWFPDGRDARRAGRDGHGRGEGRRDRSATATLGDRGAPAHATPAASPASDSADGEQLAADAVVCTLDLPIAYEQLLPDLRPPRALRRPRYSPSAVVWHVGVRGLPDPEVAHHNIHFGQRVGRRLRRPAEARRADAATRPGWSPCRRWTTRRWRRRAARRCSSSSRCPTSPTAGSTGRAEAGPMRERLHGLPGAPRDTRPTSSPSELVTPLDWQAQGMAAGTPFALAHTFAQTGPFRPPNVERRVPGLFFAGSGTVPGVGVPMVLISGKLAADRVDAYLGGGP